MSPLLEPYQYLKKKPTTRKGGGQMLSPPNLIKSGCWPGKWHIMAVPPRCGSGRLSSWWSGRCLCVEAGAIFGWLHSCWRSWALTAYKIWIELHLLLQKYKLLSDSGDWPWSAEAIQQVWVTVLSPVQNASVCDRKPNPLEIIILQRIAGTETWRDCSVDAVNFCFPTRTWKWLWIQSIL